MNDIATAPYESGIDQHDADRIKRILNVEVVRRLLVRYFLDKGFDRHNLDRQVYPAILQDLTTTIPCLMTKVEVIPHTVDIDPHTGRAILGWNLFVLGSHRMYLGDTYHDDLRDLARQIRSGAIRTPQWGHYPARRQTTPRCIIAFITRVLSDHEGGYVDLRSTAQPVRPIGEPYAIRQALMGTPQQLFSR